MLSVHHFIPKSTAWKASRDDQGLPPWASAAFLHPLMLIHPRHPSTEPQSHDRCRPRAKHLVIPLPLDHSNRPASFPVPCMHLQDKSLFFRQAAS